MFMIMKFFFILFCDFDRCKINLGDGVFEINVKFWGRESGWNLLLMIRKNGFDKYINICVNIKCC